MRAYSWILLGGFALACGGSAFTTSPGGGSDAGSGNTSGTGTTAAGSESGGDSGGSSAAGGTEQGGSSSTGGVISGGGDLSVGGDLVTGGSLPGGGDTSSAGAPPSPIDEGCPMSAPAPGGACVDGLSCSYGTDVRVACRVMAKCDGGSWSVDDPQCEAIHSCQEVSPGKSCDPSVKPCVANGEQLCVCTGCGSGGPCSNETVWVCAGGSGSGSCPKLAPNAGQTCDGDAKCNYGSCATGNGISATCDGSTWSWDAVICPL